MRLLPGGAEPMRTVLGLLDLQKTQSRQKKIKKPFFPFRRTSAMQLLTVSYYVI